MNVFISWSGKNTRSHQTALLLKDWLPKVIQKVSCFVSSHDIDAGARWANDLFNQLEQCNVGILCLTPECLTQPWLLFEAGALAKMVDNSKVCPLLIDLSPSDVGFPLAAFQLKGTDREGIKGIVEMVNKSRGNEALNENELEEAFDYRWPQFAKRFVNLPATQESAQKKVPESKTQLALDELLDMVRGIAGGRIKVSSKSDPASDYAARSAGGMLKAAIPYLGSEVLGSGNVPMAIMLGNLMLKELKSSVLSNDPVLENLLDMCEIAMSKGKMFKLYFPVSCKAMFEFVNISEIETQCLNLLSPSYSISEVEFRYLEPL